MARVLIVEDEPYNRELALEICKRAGHQVVAVAHAHEALLALAGDRVDLVLLDINLGGIDGIAVTHALRATPAWVDLPILGISARTDRATVDGALRAGMNGFLPKPYRASALLAAIAHLLPSAPGVPIG